MKKLSILTITTCALIQYSASGQGSVLNGSFEDHTAFLDIAYLSELDVADGTLSAVDNVGTASNWVFGSDAGLLGGNTTDGEIAAWLNPNSGKSSDASIYQDIFLNVGNYNQLSWSSFASPGEFETIHQYNVQVVNLSTSDVIYDQTFFENAFDGLATSHITGLNVANFGTHRLSFTALPAPSDLAASAGDIFIDNVVVVPEPSASLLVLLAGVVAGARRRR